MTRSGNFARKNLKLVSRAKRKKLYFWRFLTLQFIIIFYVLNLKNKNNFKTFFMILVFCLISNRILVTFCSRQIRKSGIGKSFSVCPDLAISRKSGAFYPFFAPRFFADCAKRKNCQKWRFLGFWNFYVVKFKYF